ncbi:DUF397 domain-containing protein [Streptomyces sp. B1866]|uniref:DUF397 domain-containing protein n=1 Tax=Streptomyces sp. B1866 TaxID=3075431 RepID=UPI00288CDAFE|nr:DUF397 domain-containing protein [Streptomyces sp. B1866]MDT3398173.1 DUF397 domain-containing protein [Streptomyces sp. B1866]
MTGYTCTDEKTALTWRKSSYSGGEQGQCVEVAETPSKIHIRDSKNPDGPSLALPRADFSAFLQFAASEFEV